MTYIDNGIKLENQIAQDLFSFQIKFLKCLEGNVLNLSAPQTAPNIGLGRIDFFNQIMFCHCLPQTFN